MLLLYPCTRETFTRSRNIRMSFSPYGNISCELHPSHVESHMCISGITCAKNSHVFASEKRISHAHAVLHIMYTRSSFRNVLSMCSDSDLFTSFIYLLCFLCQRIFLKNHTRVIQNNRLTDFLRTPLPNQTMPSNRRFSKPRRLTISMSSAMGFFTRSPIFDRCAH